MNDEAAQAAALAKQHKQNHYFLNIVWTAQSVPNQFKQF